MKTSFLEETGSVWRTAGGGNGRAGWFPQNLKPGPRPAGKLAARGAIQAAPVFDEAGKAFIADLSGGLQAWSPDGEILWRREFGDGILATPVIHPTEPHCFVGTLGGLVASVDTDTGEVRWQKALPTLADPRILSDLLVLPRAGVVVVSSWGGRFHALEVSSGESRVDWEAGIYPRSAAIADDDEVLYLQRAVWDRGVEFVRFNLREGETVLLKEPEDERGARRAVVAASPALDRDSGVVYLVSPRRHGGRMIAWSTGSNKEIWRVDLPATVQGAPTVLPGPRVVVADLAGNVLALGGDGREVYRCSLGSDYLLAGGVGLRDGTFLVGDPEGTVHAVNAQGEGRRVWESPRGVQGRLAFDPQGRLHVPCTDGFVYRFPVRGV